MIDIEPATAALSQLLGGVRDDQLPGPTPCQEMTVGDLIDQVNGFSLAFAAAATKATGTTGSQAPSPDGSKLETDWRTRIPTQLAELAAAWRQPDAWTGMTKAGGLDLPGEVAGMVALNEILLHSWDLARAVGQAVDPEPALVEAAFVLVEGFASRSPAGTPGLFGPVVPVPAEAPAFDQLLGLAGRNPAWSCDEEP